MSTTYRFILALVVSLIPGWSQALTLRTTSLEELYKHAHIVVLAEVETISARPWATKPGATWSDVHIRVLSTFKGTPGERLTVGLPGGSRNGVSTLVFGVPQLSVGQRAVFMLERVGDDLVPLNYGQGVWPEEVASAFSGGPIRSAQHHNSVTRFKVMTTTSGAQVHWSNRCVEVWTNDVGSTVFDSLAIRQVLAESFAHWEDAQGGELQGIDRGYTCFDEVGFDDWPGPQNVIQFREEEGSWKHPPKIAGLTTIMYREHNGEIVDADIEFNLVSERFTVDGSVDSFSLRYTMTHELGHLLGLDHSTIHASVMAVNSVPKNVGDFGLHPDDKNAIAANYPAGEGDASCGANNYFAAGASYCPAAPESSGCTASVGSAPWALLLSLLCLAFVRRNRRLGRL